MVKWWRKFLRAVAKVDPLHFLGIDLQGEEIRFCSSCDSLSIIPDLHNAPIRRDNRVLVDIVGAEAVARRGGRVDPAAEEEAPDPDTAALAVDVGELGGRQDLLHSLPLCAGSQKDLRSKKEHMIDFSIAHYCLLAE